MHSLAGEFYFKEESAGGGAERGAQVQADSLTGPQEINFRAVCLYIGGRVLGRHNFILINRSSGAIAESFQSCPRGRAPSPDPPGNARFPAKATAPSPYLHILSNSELTPSPAPS